MALFSLKKIAAIAQNRQAYLRGVALYNAGRITRFDSAQNEYYREFITADIRGDRENTLHVEIGMNGAGEAEYLSCSCDSFRPSSGACKHIVCSLVDKYYRDMLDTPVEDTPAISAPERTGQTAQQLMRAYFARDTRAMRPTEKIGDIRLIPTLILSGLKPLLSLSLQVSGGADPYDMPPVKEKTYIIKDIGRFGAAVRSGEPLSYGQHLSFYHDPSAFTPDSRKLLSFLLSELSDRETVGQQASFGRSLPLTPGGLDRLLSLYTGRPLPLCRQQGTLPVTVTDGDPRLSITVQKAPGGLTFLTSEVIPLSGNDTVYVIAGSTLYRCSEEFSATARDWLIAAHLEPDGLFVTNHDLPAFCAKVLTAVRPAFELIGEEALADCLPLPLNTKIFLDAPDEGTVTARVLFCYGEREIPLFTDAQPDERRDLRLELAVRLLIERFFTGYLPETDEVVFHGDDDRIYAFLSEGLPALEQRAALFASDAFKRLRPVPPPQVSVGVQVQGDLLQLDVDLTQWSREELTALFSQFRANKPFTRLKSGAFVSLDDETLSGLMMLSESLALTPEELKSGRISLPRYRAIQLEGLLAARPVIRFRQDKVFRALVDTLQNSKQQRRPVPALLENILRPYQKEGFYWLKTLEEAGFGGILADDMGLGKTVEIISILLDAADRTPLPSLVVCPTSLVLNWVSELHRFAPSLTVLAVTGDAGTREQLLTHAAEYRVVVTSYDLLKRDIALYRPLRFYYHILDEAQYIKNQKTQNARAVKAIASERRFALTGTPMENRLAELWSIFDFLMPGFLYSYSYFKSRFELPVVRDGDREALQRLAATVSPFLLRRLKQDVLTELPPKTEQVLLCSMGEEQRKLYAACALQTKDRIRRAISDGTFEKRRLSVLTLLMRLRQLCCDPSLCVDDYTGNSCKREACLELVRNACDNGHRVLLFSQFTSMLDLLEKDLEKAGITHMLLKGSTPAAERAKLVSDFNEGNTQVFLISLKAGGTGLNLTGADVVIHYDPWWNLAAQQQATDRAHRIGQRHPVQVVRLVTQNTIEQNILQLQERKQQIADAILSAGLPSLSALSAEELLALV